MDRMRRHAERVQYRRRVRPYHRVELSQRPFRLFGDNGEYSLRRAHHRPNGASAKYLGLKSEETFRGKGVSGLRDLRRLFLSRQGGGLWSAGVVNTAVEEALYLTNIASHVTWCIAVKSCARERILQDRLFALESAGKANIVWNHSVDEILGNEAGVTGVRLRGAAPGAARTLHVDGRIHRRGPSTQTPSSSTAYWTCAAATSWSRAAARGDEATATSVAGVFAAGDVADHVYAKPSPRRAPECHGRARRRQYLETGGGGTFCRAARSTRVTQCSARSLGGIAQIDAASWNSLLRDGEPFLRHEFLPGARGIRLRGAAHGLDRAALGSGRRARPPHRRHTLVPQWAFAR